MRTEHLADEEMLDALEGGDAADHAAACPECSARVRAAAATLAELADVDIPSLSPQTLRDLQEGVRRGIDAEVRRTRRWRVGGGLTLFAAAAALAAVAIRVPPPSVPAAPALPAWSALPAQDPALNALAGLDELADVSCVDVQECLAGLSEAEGQALVSMVQHDLKGGDS